jgi:hypothetical protein
LALLRILDSHKRLADQALRLGHRSVVGGQRFEILASGLEQCPLGIQDIQKAKFPLPIAFAERLKGALGSL